MCSLVGFSIIRFGLNYFSLTLGSAVVWWGVLGACLAEYLLLPDAGIGKWFLFSGLLGGVVTFFLAKPMTYLFGFIIGFDIGAIPIILVSKFTIGDQSWINCFVVVVGIVCGVIFLKKFKSHLRTFIIGLFGGGILAHSIGNLLWLILLPTSWNTVLTIWLLPYIMIIGGTMYILFKQPAFANRFVLFPKDEETSQPQ